MDGIAIKNYPNFFIDEKLYSVEIENLAEILISRMFGHVINSGVSIFVTHKKCLPLNIANIVDDAPITIKTLCGYNFFIILNHDEKSSTQFVFQFAHELTHVLAEGYPTEEKFKWVIEVFCEISSLFALHEMQRLSDCEATDCKVAKLEFAAYFVLIFSAIDEENKILSLHDLYLKYEAELPVSPYGKTKMGVRCRNLAIAARILMFCDYRQFLYALTYLPKLDYGKIMSTYDLFANWSSELKQTDNLCISKSIAPRKLCKPPKSGRIRKRLWR